MPHATLCALLAALVLAPASSGLARPAKPLVVSIAVTKKGVAGGAKRVVVKKDRRVVLLVRSALGGYVHVHGYNVMRAVRAGGTARLGCVCSLTGRFEVELHGRVPLQLAVIDVRP